ncbi:MAG: hypothetical protein KDA61_20830, partial [Planctomycetales bacterium]|nr:hypothetical protein [Planctomycetales bacterium]
MTGRLMQSHRRSAFRAILGTTIWLMPLAASAAWALVDDFDSLIAGPLDNQGGWTASGGVTVASDPADTSNQTLSVESLGAIVRHALLIPEGNAGTLFLRVRFGSQLSGSFG